MAGTVGSAGVEAWAVYFSSGTANWTGLSGTGVNSVSVPSVYSGGKLYLIVQDRGISGGSAFLSSVSGTITQESQLGFLGNPSTNSQVLNYRFDSFEFTFTPSADDQGNLTNVNGFGIPMKVEVGYHSGTAPTVSWTETRGYSSTASGSAMWSSLESAGAVIYPYSSTSGGVSYSLSGKSRAIAAPTEVVGLASSTRSSAVPSLSASYQSSNWLNYISMLISTGAMTSGSSNQIHLGGYFNGAAQPVSSSTTSTSVWHNGGFYSYDVVYNSTTSNIVLTATANSQIQGAITLTIAELANSIYSTLGSASIGGVTGGLISSTMNTGANNQWGAVIRDFVTGFTGGYYNRLGTPLNSSVSGQINLNKEWNWDPTYAFQSHTSAVSGSAPVSSGLDYIRFDPYAKVFYDNTDSYGAGYSDNLMKAFNVGPLISVADGTGAAVDSTDITITLFDDTDAPSGYQKPTIYNYTSTTSSYAAPTWVGDGTNLTFDFTAGKMALAQNTPVTLRAMSATTGYTTATMTSAGYYTLQNGGAVTSNSGQAAQVGIYQLTNLAFAAGVNWYQIDVGTGSAAKTFNLYMSAGTSGGTPHLLNPTYVASGGAIQAAAFAVDGLAATTAANIPTSQYTLTPKVVFFNGGATSLDPSLLTPITSAQLTSALLTSNVGLFLQPYAPVLGVVSGGTFSQLYNPQYFPVSSGATTIPLPTPTSTFTLGASTVYGGWYGADNAQVWSGTVSAGAYTNKINGNSVARLTVSATGGGSLPLINHMALTRAADSDGQWTMAAPIHFGAGSGTYTVVMNEYLATDTAFLTPIAKASAVQSFTISATADATVSSGVTASNGQTLSNTILVSGASLTVNSGGTTSAMTLAGDGVSGQVLGAARWTVMSGGAHLFVSSGATTTGSIVISGSAEYVSSGAAVSGTDLAAHGHAYIGTGGTISGAVISGSGSAWISGTAIGTTLAGGWQTVSSGGVASNTVALAGGYANVSSGGIASGTTVSNGGAEFVGLGGIARGTVVFNNGRQVVSSGGTASNTILSTHGYGYVLAGGAISGAVISGSGSGYIAGIAVSTTLAGGWQVVSSGGVASGTQLQAGGYEAISSSGTVSGAVASAGGAEYVSSGGTLSGATLSGGLVIVSSGGIVSGTITFAGSGALILEDSDAFSGTIAGLSDAYETVHLRDMNFATVSHTYSNSGTSGTLSVTDGTDTAILALIGQYTAASFHFAADSNGGTYLWDPPADHTPSGLVTSG